jgi:hypothetical protein
MWGLLLCLVAQSGVITIYSIHVCYPLARTALASPCRLRLAHCTIQPPRSNSDQHAYAILEPSLFKLLLPDSSSSNIYLTYSQNHSPANSSSYSAALPPAHPAPCSCTPDIPSATSPSAQMPNPACRSRHRWAPPFCRTSPRSRRQRGKSSRRTSHRKRLPFLGRWTARCRASCRRLLR